MAARNNVRTGPINLSLAGRDRGRAACPRNVRQPPSISAGNGLQSVKA